MSTESTKRMLSAYHEKSMQKPGYLTQKFRTPPENFYDSLSVELDVRRAGHKVAIAVRSMSDSGKMFEDKKFENKEFVPPVYKPKFHVELAENLLKRRAGKSPFQDPDFMAAVSEDFQRHMEDAEGMIRRAIELQAAQLLQTGVVDCKDESGATVKQIDFAMKSTHKPNASQDWDEASGTNRLKDCEDLITRCKDDGNADNYDLDFGEDAFRSFIADPEVQDQFRKDGTGLGQIQRPEPRAGGTFHGWLSIGPHVAQIWSYRGYYEDHANSNAATRYISPWNVIASSRDARLDLAFGGIPQVFPPDPRLEPIGLGRAASVQRGIDMFAHAWFDESESNIFGSIAARPLVIPTAIDTFGCLNAKAT